MTPQLINRLKDNLEWLAKEMPEKFKNLSAIYFRSANEEYDSFPLVNYSPFKVEPDPQQIFSNSLYRIIYEATQEEMMFWFDFQDGQRTVYFRRDGEIMSHFEIESTEQLSAEIESVCLRIEQMRKES